MRARRRRWFDDRDRNRADEGERRVRNGERAYSDHLRDENARDDHHVRGNEPIVKMRGTAPS